MKVSQSTRLDYMRGITRAVISKDKEQFNYTKRSNIISREFSIEVIFEIGMEQFLHCQTIEIWVLNVKNRTRFVEILRESNPAVE